MKILIYGTGCAKCDKTYEIVRQAVAEVGVNAEVGKVSDIREIVMAGVMTTPAVSVDGAIKIAGRMPTVDDVKGWISG